MADIPKPTLQWLWSNLQGYQHANAAYSDVVAALSQYPSLQPRTETYTDENGQSALLVCLYGTIPVSFRRAQYRYPLEIWVPQRYGERGIGVFGYVRPEANARDAGPVMVIRPGQHVASDGKVYHPYLRDWSTQRHSSIVEFLGILHDVFAREPPIVADHKRTQTAHVRRDRGPTLPPKVSSANGSREATRQSPEMSSPPPLPSKPGQAPPNTSNASPRAQAPPPLPALPAEYASSSTLNHSLTSTPATAPHSHAFPSPNLSQQPHYTRDSADHTIHPRPSPHAMYAYPASLQADQSQFQGQRLAPTQIQQPLPYRPGPLKDASQRFVLHSSTQKQMEIRHQPLTHQSDPRSHQSTVPKQMPDLLSDPFDVTLPASLPTGPAPPIPPNPEREHLLQLLSQSFVAQVNAQIQQSQAAILPLTAQHHALLEAQSKLESELYQLQAMDSVITTNENILAQSIHDCQSVIQANKQALRPDIDDVLVAPTIAEQQLWTLCAEEAAIKEVMYCLQRGVGAGRISGAGFVKLTRSLARELFLKKATARKIAVGLDLDIHAGR